MSTYLNVPNVDFSGRCLSCGNRVESSAGCTCQNVRLPFTDVGDGHRYEEIWDDKGRRWVCKDCGAHLFQDRIICTRNRPL